MEVAAARYTMALRTHVKWTGGEKEKEEQEQNTGSWNKNDRHGPRKGRTRRKEGRGKWR